MRRRSVLVEGYHLAALLYVTSGNDDTLCYNVISGNELLYAYNTEPKVHSSFRYSSLIGISLFCDRFTTTFISLFLYLSFRSLFTLSLYF